MSPLLSISQSGIQAAQTRLGVAANNIANSQTDDFKRQVAQANARADGGVVVKISSAATQGNDQVQDVVDQLSAKQSFAANIAVLKNADKMLGSLLDTKA